MNQTFTTYNLATGEIGANISCPEDVVEANTPAGFGRIEGQVNGELFWVRDGVAVEREQMTLNEPMTINVTSSVISGLPIPCVATIEGVRYVVDDGTLELDADLPGPYEVRLEAVAYLPVTVTIP